MEHEEIVEVIETYLERRAEAQSGPGYKQIVDWAFKLLVTSLIALLIWIGKEWSTEIQGNSQAMGMLRMELAAVRQAIKTVDDLNERVRYLERQKRTP